MIKMSNENLDNTTGGNTTINGPIINAVISIIDLLREAGYSLGSGIRRFSENKVCPLE
ncbi:MAG: hypothetical protein IJG97_02495 [Bacilli bacterium]|nr:hypothetical protein [Bacilli bacterium]